MKENWFKRIAKTKNTAIYGFEGESGDELIITIPDYIEESDRVILLSEQEYNYLIRNMNFTTKSGEPGKNIFAYSKDAQLVAALRSLIRQKAQLKIGQELYTTTYDILGDDTPEWWKQRLAAIRVEVIVGECEGYSEGTWFVQYLNDKGREIDSMDIDMERIAFNSFEEMKEDAIKRCNVSLKAWENVEEGE